MLGEQELARKCGELIDENARLREQVDGLQAALEMRAALRVYSGGSYNLGMGDTLKLQCDCGGAFQLKPDRAVRLDIV